MAGTCRQYSKSAIDQLTRITFHNATPLNFRWPYHAKVMKMFDPISNTIGHTRAPIDLLSESHLELHMKSHKMLLA